MSNNNEDVFSIFRELARKLGMIVGTPSNGSIVMTGRGFIMTVETESDRVPGVFVTIGKMSPGAASAQMYALRHLVEFGGGTILEVKNAVTGDPATVLALVEKFAVSYLQGVAEDFPAFEAYCMRKAEEEFPEYRGFTANKWIRAEWIDKPRP
jgi:hypothetical protein